MYSDRAAGTANNAATIHTPQIVAPIARHVGCEETRTWRGFTVTLYLCMLNTATEYPYVVRSIDIRLQIGRNAHKMSCSLILGILFAQA
jgi:hypothetical protein